MTCTLNVRSTSPAANQALVARAAEAFGRLDIFAANAGLTVMRPFLETSEADALVHASFLPERMGAMVFPMKAGRPDVGRAVFVQNYMFYKRAGSPVAWDGKALSGADGPVGGGSSLPSEFRLLSTFVSLMLSAS